jgi:hypothetical protein
MGGRTWSSSNKFEWTLAQAVMALNDMLFSSNTPRWVWRASSNSFSLTFLLRVWSLASDDSICFMDMQAFH